MAYPTDHQQAPRRMMVAVPLLIIIAFIAGGYAMRDGLGSVWKGSEKEIPVAVAQQQAGETLDPIAGEARMISIVEKANDAVISVVVTKDVPILERYYEEFNPFGDGWGSFRIPRVRERGTESQEVGGGSGFLVSPEGHIVTNRHVVADEGAEYTVFLNDGSKYPAEVIARDTMLDIAIIKINRDGAFPYLSFANSDSLRLGQTAIAIGNALGEFRNSVSVGVVSGLSRSIVAGDARGGSLEELSDVIQTDAAINPGNSGGPLLDSSGSVIGVNVAVALGSENIGFALPGNAVKAVVDSVRATGEIVRPYLGVRYQMLTPELAEAAGAAQQFGAYVSDEEGIVPDSPAQKAGLQNGDIIVSANGLSLENRSLASVLQSLSVGDRVTLGVVRGSQQLEIVATLERMPNDL